MDSESPSRPEPEPCDAPQKPSPAIPGREPPRLSIVHFLVWTACVALYLGLTRMISDMVLASAADPNLAPGTTRDVLAGTFHGIGSGAALAGLLLFASRPSRGFRFPQHPGEYLWVLLGFGVAIRLLSLALATIEFRLMGGHPQFNTWIVLPFFWLSIGAHVVIWVWALWRVKKRRWRNYFATLIVANMLHFAPFYSPMYLGPGATIGLAASLILRLTVDAVLVVVVLQDLFDGSRYPWTHWVGVATRLWFTAVSVGTTLLYLLSS